jgi:CHAT domain-containing protein/tetratricopeptide (TPR) repeat protein
MPQPESDIETCLSQLVRAPPDGRMAFFRSINGDADRLAALADEAERLSLVEVGRSLDAADALVDLADATGLHRARVRRARAQALAYAGRHDEALQVCNEACRLAQQSGDRIEEARARLISLHPLNELGRHDEAISAGQAARAALMALGETKLAARADFNMGGIYQNRDDPARALEHFDRAAPAFAGDPLITGYLNNNRGEALLLLNQFDAARQAFEQALSACLGANASLAVAIVEGNLADLAARCGQLPEALRYFERARRRLEADKAESHLARLLAEQAEAVASLGLAADALSEYRRVIPRLAACGLVSEVARAHLDMGRLFVRLERYPEAAETLELAAAEYRQLGHFRATALVDLRRAELALQRGETDAAAALLRDAEPNLRARPLDVALCDYHVAALAVQRGDLTSAETRINAASCAARQLGVAPLLADLLTARGEIRRAGGRFAAAVEDFRAATWETERVRGALQAEQFRAAYLGNRLTAYEGLVQTTLDLHGDAGTAEAFDAIERAKSRGLLDLLRGAQPVEKSGSASATTRAQREIARRLAAELNALYCRLADTNRNPVGQLDTSDWAERVAARERDLAEIERRLAASGGAGELYSSPTPLRIVQQRLPPDAALVEFFLARDELLALTVTDKRISVHRQLTSKVELADCVQQLRFQMNRAARPGAVAGERGTRLLEQVRSDLNELYRKVFEPIRESLADFEHLIIVPHGPLHLVPFQALWDGRAYLIECFTVSYAPSASVWDDLASRSRNDTPELPALVVGAGDEFAPWIESEAQALAELLQAKSLLGTSATRQRVRAELQKSTVAHLACHAAFSDQHPSASGLRLADGWLTLREILPLRLQAELVTLSGCSTGVNAIHAGDELVGLQRAFLSAGVNSLLVTLWAADDAAVYHTILDFYTLWRKSPDGVWAKAGALRIAQNRAIERTPHPFFWAPFSLVGKP